MRRAVVVVAVCVLARAPAPEREGVRGAWPGTFRIDRIDDGWPALGDPPWPDQAFWDRIHGVAPRQPRVGPPLPVLGGPVDVDFDEMPFRDVVRALGRAAGVRIVLHPAIPTEVAGIPVTLAADDLAFRDALDLVLMQASAEGDIVYELSRDSIRVRPR